MGNKEITRRDFCLNFLRLAGGVLIDPKGLVFSISQSSEKKPKEQVKANLLIDDFLPPESLPEWFQDRLKVPEIIGPLPKDFYAVHTYILEITTEKPKRRGEVNKEDRNKLQELTSAVNQWFSEQLSNRKIRFIHHGLEGKGIFPGINEIITSQNTIANRETVLIELLENMKNELPDLGSNQKINVLFVKGGEDLVTFAAPNTVVMSLPESLDPENIDKQAGILAHLLGHALGLSHPLDDIDTLGTPLESNKSFMHPSVATRGLSKSIILNSQLNPQISWLAYTGFFAYEGITYTENDGAIPLEKGLVLEVNSGEEVKIAHGNYIFECKPTEPAIIIRSENGTVDFGSAIIKGQRKPFEKYGENRTNGIGVLIEGSDIKVKGGIFSGFHYGVKAQKINHGELVDITSINNRRMPYDPRRGIDDTERGVWLNFWLPPEDDEKEDWLVLPEDVDSYGAYGACIALFHCRNTICREVLVGHSTIGVADYYGESNRFEDGDFSECAMGLRFWKSKGKEGSPIIVENNRFHFNTQPFPWWWSGGDGAAILGVSLKNCQIKNNKIWFGGDGVFLASFPRLYGNNEQIEISGNRIFYCYAHGVEIDFAGPNCMISGNEICNNWLSGVWAGRSAGLLIVENMFKENNNGRLFREWVDSQGAVSCPQGRVTIVGNKFENNPVGVNLWQDFSLPFFPFSGSAKDHRVVGNEFNDNKIAVRLSGVTESKIANNRMRNNERDIDIEEEERENNHIGNNGPEIDPSQARVIHLPVESIWFDNETRQIEFPVLKVSPKEVGTVPVKEIKIDYYGDNPWLNVSQRNDGITLSVSPDYSQLNSAIKSARLLIRLYESDESEKTVSVPVSLMQGSFQVEIGHGIPEEGGENLGQSFVGPSTYLGFFSPISQMLQTEKPTNITGSQPFWLLFRQENCELPFGAHHLLVSGACDDQINLFFTNDSQPITLSPPWDAKLISLEEDAETQLPKAGKIEIYYQHHYNNAPPITALWFYPLTRSEVEYLNAMQERGQDFTTLLPNLPGLRRSLNPLEIYNLTALRKLRN